MCRPDRGALRALLSPAAMPLIAAFLALTPHAAAQDVFDDADLAPPRLHAGIAGAIAQPLGEFNDHVRVGGGVQAFFRVDLDERGRIGLRIDGGFVTYGRETQNVCLSATVGCRIVVDLTTSNNILLLGVGPELGIPWGRTRLYANATLGLGYFSTDSEVSGTGDQEPFASTRNFSDGGLAWNAGGGVQIGLGTTQGQTISLDLGVSHQENGRREYLTPGGITDNPDGSLEFDVKRSQANFLLWRIGVSVGIRPGVGGS